MNKLFGISLSAAVFCLASSLSSGQELATKGDAGTTAQPQEHVRHMRAHKTPGVGTDVSQNNEMPEPAVAKQSESGSGKAPKASAAPLQSKKKQVAQRDRSRVAANKQTANRPVIPHEAPQQKQSDFFEELFN